MAAGESQTTFPLSLLFFLPPHFAERSCQKLLPGVVVLAPWSLVVMPAHEGGECRGGEVHGETPCVSAGTGNG